MNWGALTVVGGLVALASVTMPWGLVILVVGFAWLLSKS